ncbi:integral membrane [Fusarium longipes]|uniref:Integral membrane n=1 Tax=Fusarium longipes TaxID=694270 RepID=A0A395RLV4_9HYPO|nr:integral membrane [Fusarium longipes]
MGLWDVDDFGVIADKACWSMFAVTTVVVVLRLISRQFFGQGNTGGGLGWDDFITAFCVIVMLITCIMITIGTHYGLGQRLDDIDPALIPSALKWNVIISSVLIWTFSLPKFAIIATLKRILDYGLKTTILFWGLALSSQACILATSIWWYKQCDPVEFGWDRSIPGGTCASVQVMSDLGYFTSAYSAFLDGFFALYPIPFIMRLNMPLKNRILVSIALGLSFMACILSIYKLTIFGEIFVILAENPTYPVPFLDILGLGEGCILLICASLPTLGPLFRLVKGKISTTNASRITDSSKKDTHSGQSSGRWDKLGGQQGDDMEHGSSRIGSSVDDIPLVVGLNHATNNSNKIHKTVEFGVSHAEPGNEVTGNQLGGFRGY